MSSDQHQSDLERPGPRRGRAAGRGRQARRRSSPRRRSASAATATRTPSGRTSPPTSASGPTALYHYFESKQHCLYVIMDQAIEGFRVALRAADAPTAPIRSSALVAVMADCFDLSEHDVQRNRVLVAEQGLLVAAQRLAARGGGAPGRARPHTRDLEFAWASFLVARDGAGRDPRERPAPAHARDPRPLQQHLALVPPERDRRR